MDPLAPYLPPHLLRVLAKRGRGAEAPGGERIAAALMAWQLATPGPGSRRPEALLQTAVRAVGRWGGSIVDLGLGGVLALFGGSNPVSRAASAAGAIEEVSSQLDVRLPARLFVHAGNVEALHLGSAERCHYVIVGPAVETTTKHAGNEEAEGLVLSQAAVRLRKAEGKPRPAAAATPHVAAGLLRPYLDVAVSELLRAGKGDAQDGAVLLLESRGFSLPALQGFFEWLHQTVDGCQGRLIGSHATENGLLWVVAFGLGGTYAPDAPHRAAERLLSQLPRGLKVRAAIAHGATSLRMVGTRERRKVELHGEAVQSARSAVAEAEWGELVLGSEARRAGRAQAARPAVPLLERDDAVDAVGAALAAARKGAGSSLVVTGAPGSGRSRLVAHAMEMARAEGFQACRAEPVAFGAMPWQLAGELVLRLLGLARTAFRDVIMARAREECERLALPELSAHHLGELAGIRAWGSPLEHVDAHDIGAACRRSLELLLAARSREAPLLIVVEDLHLADHASRELFLDLKKRLGPMAVLLVLTFEATPRLKGLATDVTLELLTDEGCRALLRDLCGPLPEVVEGYFVARAAGSPMYVEQLAAYVRGTGTVAMLRSGSVPDAVPFQEACATARSLLAARLHLLTEGALGVIQRAAVVGLACPLPLLRQLGPEDEALDPYIDELVAQGLIVSERSASGDVTVALVHELVRDSVYESIPPEERARLHLAAGQSIDGIFLNERRAFIAMLGHHWERAGQLRVARSSYLEGARQAAAVGALADARRLYLCASGLIEEPDAEAVAIRAELATRVLLPLREFVWGHRELARAADDARGVEHPGLLASVLLALGELTVNEEQREEAFDLLSSLSRAAGEERQRASAAALARLAVSAHEEARLGDAQRLYAGALAAFGAARDRRREGVLLGNLARVHAEMGMVTESRTLYERALLAHRELGDRRLEGIVLARLGALHARGGSHQDSHDAWEQSLIVARRLGDRRREAMALLGLARLERLAGSSGSHEKLEQAERLLGAGVPATGPERLLLCCEKGHAVLASGRSASPVLSEARTLAGAVDGHAKEIASRAIARLERAVSDFDVGHPLEHGESASG